MSSLEYLDSLKALAQACWPSLRGLKLNAQRASQPASQLKEGRAADQKDRVVFALSAIIGGIVAYQFPQKRTLLSMRGISVISHNTIIIFLKQGRKWWVGRVGNCPPRFWQIRRRRRAALARRITTCPPRFRKLLTPL